MKKYIILILEIGFILCLCGCSSKNNPEVKNELSQQRCFEIGINDKYDAFYASEIEMEYNKLNKLLKKSILTVYYNFSDRWKEHYTMDELSEIVRKDDCNEESEGMYCEISYDEESVTSKMTMNVNGLMTIGEFKEQMHLYDDKYKCTEVK